MEWEVSCAWWTPACFPGITFNCRSRTGKGKVLRDARAEGGARDTQTRGCLAEKLSSFRRLTKPNVVAQGERGGCVLLPTRSRKPNQFGNPQKKSPRRLEWLCRLDVRGLESACPYPPPASAQIGARRSHSSSPPRSRTPFRARSGVMGYTISRQLPFQGIHFSSQTLLFEK